MQVGRAMVDVGVAIRTRHEWATESATGVIAIFKVFVTARRVATDAMRIIEDGVL